MFKGRGVTLLNLAQFSLISHENEIICLTETKLFHCHMIFKIGREVVPSEPPQDPPLIFTMYVYFIKSIVIKIKWLKRC